MYAAQHDRILNAIMDLVTSPTNIAWPVESENILVGPGGGGVGPRQGINPDAARRLADALCMREQRLEHSGTISITGSLPRQDRGYSRHTGANNLKPVPPVNPPAVVRGLIEVSNQPDGDSDKRGENGYSFYSKDGVVRSDGETWILKAGRVVASASVTDARADELDSDVKQKHYYANCFECSDKKGRDTTDTTVRVFTDDPGALRNTDAIHYVRDLNGLAYQVGPNPGVRYGVVQPGYDNKAVYDGASNPDAVTLKACEYSGLNTTSATFTSKVIYRANKDTALFTDYVVAYIGDDEGGRVVISDCYDEPIKKSVQVWNGTSSTIKDGWSLSNGDTITLPGGSTPVTTLNLNSTFIMGITTNALVGTTGGSHPIRPRQHDDSESFSTTTTWFSTWKDTAWRLTAHPSHTLSTDETGLTVDSYTGTSGTFSLSIIGRSATSSLAVIGESGTSSLAIIGESDSETVAIDTHPEHYHPPGMLVDVVISTSTTTTGATTTSVWANHPSGPVISNPDNAESFVSLSHIVDPATHTHDVGTFGLSPDPHLHDVGSFEITPDPHDHGVGTFEISPDPHDHSIDHIHSTTDPGHYHTSPSMSHAGSLWHREEDFRPPFARLPYIQRTH